MIEASPEEILGPLNAVERKNALRRLDHRHAETDTDEVPAHRNPPLQPHRKPDRRHQRPRRGDRRSCTCTAINNGGRTIAILNMLLDHAYPLSLVEFSNDLHAILGYQWHHPLLIDASKVL